jgi:hypothetical protein
MKKNRSVQAFTFIGIVSLLPTLAFAAGEQQLVQSFGSVKTIIDSFTSGILSSLGTLFATAALVAFFYGIVQYIWGVRDGKPEKVNAGNKFMLWGLIALFVMFSVWGIIIFFQRIFGISGQSSIVIPKIEIGGSSALPTYDTGLPNSPNSPTGECAGIRSERERDACFAAQASGNECAGRAAGSPCSPAGGISRYCQVNDENQQFGCFAGDPCPAGQVPGMNGCTQP